MYDCGIASLPCARAVVVLESAVAILIVVRQANAAGQVPTGSLRDDVDVAGEVEKAGWGLTMIDLRRLHGHD